MAGESMAGFFPIGRPQCRANQYGRTTFLFAGVPGMQMPVSFYKDPTHCGFALWRAQYL